MHLRVLRVSGRRPARLALLGLAALLGGCDVDSPGRLTTNLRTASQRFYPSGIPAGSVTLEGSLDRISVAIDRLPVLTGPTQSAEGFAYEGWITTPDSVKSTGRFRIAASQNQDPESDTGSVRFSYDRTGALTVTQGGAAITQGQPLSDTFDFTARAGFLLTIEADPTDDPGLGFVHLLATEPESLLSTSRPLGLILPVNIGIPGQGKFDRIDAVATLNAATGEYNLDFEGMPFIARSGPPVDVGLIYQAWFVDDDTSPPRYQSIRRFKPNGVGDVTLTGAINPGDGDGDGVPEPLDFERVVVSIEPDGLTAQQPEGQGVDTSGAIFPVVPYEAKLPNVHE